MVAALDRGGGGVDARKRGIGDFGRTPVEERREWTPVEERREQNVCKIWDQPVPFSEITVQHRTKIILKNYYSISRSAALAP